MRFLGLVFPCLALSTWGCSSNELVDESRLIDLTHPFDETTVYWPTAKSFELKRVAWGPADGGAWYAACEFSAAEHGGTHIDAPIHFAEGRRTVDEIPVGQLMGPACVIDISEQCLRDPDYLLAPSDVQLYEEYWGEIEPGSVVLVRTGFGRLYPDLRRYLGSEKRGVVADLHFPGIGVEAARLLVDRGIDLVGLDTASIDHGPSRDFSAHRIFAEANVPGLENLARLEELPRRGATVMALPMKIGGGTGGPCRVVAVLP